MEDYFKFWQLKEWLTIYEASCLALDCDPSNTDREPKGWKGFYSALSEAVELDIAAEDEYEKAIEEIYPPSCEEDENIFDTLAERYNKIIFSSLNVRGYKLGQHEDFGFPSINDANIKITSIKEWLNLKSFQPHFFSPEEPEKQTKKEEYRPEYQTYLMSIMYDTIKRYYGENYDPNDRDSVPNQIRLIAWLRDTYSLSDPEAKAIDKMLRPEQVKRPQGKK